MKSLVRIGTFRKIQCQGLKLFLSHSLCREFILKNWWCSSVYKYSESLLSLLLLQVPPALEGMEEPVRHQLSVAAPKSPHSWAGEHDCFSSPPKEFKTTKLTVYTWGRIYPSRCFDSWIRIKFCHRTSPLFTGKILNMQSDMQVTRESISNILVKQSWSISLVPVCEAFADAFFYSQILV